MDKISFLRSHPQYEGCFCLPLVADIEEDEDTAHEVALMIADWQHAHSDQIGYTQPTRRAAREYHQNAYCDYRTSPGPGNILVIYEIDPIANAPRPVAREIERWAHDESEVDYYYCLLNLFSGLVGQINDYLRKQPTHSTLTLAMLNEVAFAIGCDVEEIEDTL